MCVLGVILEVGVLVRFGGGFGCFGWCSGGFGCLCFGSCGRLDDYLEVMRGLGVAARAAGAGAAPSMYDGRPLAAALKMQTCYSFVAAEARAVAARQQLLVLVLVAVADSDAAVA